MRKSFLFALCVCFSFISISAKVLVISDIDDTIKKANTMNSVSVVYYFLKADPFNEMAVLYHDIKNYYESIGEEVKFLYLSAAYDATFAQEKWLDKHNFPLGDTILRKLGDGKTYEYKYNSLKKTLDREDAQNLKVIFFGDNSDQDPKVYKDIVDEYQLNSTAEIYIRDVSTYATFWESGWEIKKLAGIRYFFSEVELGYFENLFYISPTFETKVRNKYLLQNLIPEFTLKTLEQRIERIECLIEGYLSCDEVSDEWAKKLWRDYHNRF